MLNTCWGCAGLPFDILARFVTWNDWTQLLACLNDQGEATRPVLDTLFVSLLRTQMERTSTAALRRQQLIDTLSSLQMVKNDNTFGPMVKRHMDIIISMIQE
jgi:protein-disulfide isomerase